MKKLHMKAPTQEITTKRLVGNAPNEWDVDASGKVQNYAGQFQAKLTQLKEIAYLSSKTSIIDNLTEKQKCLKLLQSD
jgi:hypothetical protein